MAYVRATARCAIRAIPSPAGEPVGVIEAGESVRELGREERAVDGMTTGWVKVQRGNRTGWVNAAFVRASKE